MYDCYCDVSINIICNVYYSRISIIIVVIVICFVSLFVFFIHTLGTVQHVYWYSFKIIFYGPTLHIFL